MDRNAWTCGRSMRPLRTWISGDATPRNNSGTVEGKTMQSGSSQGRRRDTQGQLRTASVGMKQPTTFPSRWFSTARATRAWLWRMTRIRGKQIPPFRLVAGQQHSRRSRVEGNDREYSAFTPVSPASPETDVPFTQTANQANIHRECFLEDIRVATNDAPAE